MLLRETGEPEAAAEVFAAVRGPARGRRAALQLALALLEAGQPDAALGPLERLARDRATPAVLNAQAVALLRRDPATAPDEAFAALGRAQELAPGSPDVAFNRAWAELRAGRAGTAARRLAALVESRPRDAVARLVRVWALTRSGDTAGRDAEWEALLALAPGLGGFAEPDLARPLERLIESEHPLAAGGDPRHAAERAADALGRAERLLSAGAFDAAWREASQAVYLDPDQARAHLVLARTLRARGEDEASLRALRVALWARDEAATRRELVLYLEELGRDEDARREAAVLLAADPGDPVGRRVLGR
jgi:thioredoxin-like negative regulator of GroEL